MSQEPTNPLTPHGTPQPGSNGPGWGADPDDYSAPSQCSVCAHIDRNPESPSRYCTAFLGGIPKVFMRNQIDHRSPVDYDGGTQFHPAPDADPGALRRLNTFLDNKFARHDEG